MKQMRFSRARTLTRLAGLVLCELHADAAALELRVVALQRGVHAGLRGEGDEPANGGATEAGWRGQVLRTRRTFRIPDTRLRSTPEAKVRPST